MSKINLTFKGKQYDIDKSLLSGAIARLEAHFSELENGGEERLEGDGGEYYTLAPTPLSFRSTAPLSELQEVQINGVIVDPSNYTLEEGSTIVTFPIEYLKTLDKGDYEVAIVSESKTVNGGFTVAAPELNEYGFYYNQPYAAYVEYFGSTLAFIVKEDGTLPVIELDSEDYAVWTHTISDNTMTVVSEGWGTLHFTFSSDGTEIYSTELGIAFKLGCAFVYADNDYLYLLNKFKTGYVVKCLDTTKSYYGDIKSGINGIPTASIEYTFKDCDNLASIPVIPNSVTKAQYAFRDCDSLVNVTMPYSEETDYALAFIDCKNLISVTIPASVKGIYTGMFMQCTNLSSVVFENNSQLECISSDAFQGCASLTSIVIPEGVTVISDAFRDCTNLTSITIPDSVTRIASNVCFNTAFYNDEANWEDGVLYIGNHLIEARSPFYKDQYFIKTGTKTIACGAFWSCSLLGSVIIPDSVSHINSDAFSDCYALQSITIGNGVVAINDKVFSNCSKLTNIEFTGTMEQWNNISKGYSWNYNVPATHIHCIDGDVAL